MTFKLPAIKLDNENTGAFVPIDPLMMSGNENEEVVPKKKPETSIMAADFWYKKLDTGVKLFVMLLTKKRIGTPATNVPDETFIVKTLSCEQ